jgi:hypothetical protein
MKTNRREALRKLGFAAAAGGLAVLTVRLAVKSGPARPQECARCQSADARCPFRKTNGTCPKDVR